MQIQWDSKLAAFIGAQQERGVRAAVENALDAITGPQHRDRLQALEAQLKTLLAEREALIAGQKAHHAEREAEHAEMLRAITHPSGATEAQAPAAPEEVPAYQATAHLSGSKVAPAPAAQETQPASEDTAHQQAAVGTLGAKDGPAEGAVLAPAAREDP